ncbi:MAG: SUF system Fe-S cluster assembly protein, partial [Planctomycetes bacterium]|nr:SUF system Fe-S cluster assembly protein [Planctomycetota bacterium]
METNPTNPPAPPPPPPSSTPPGAPAASGASTPAPAGGSLRDRVVEAMRQVYDPEIPINIYDIGLIYGIEVSEAGAVHVRMTLTSPSCPEAERIPVEVEERIKTLPGVTSTKIELVWDPPWTPEKMSEAAKLQLGFY